MSELNDDLFALRLALQDTIFEESFIIKKLKEYLLKNNVPVDKIDETIINFYKNFGIDMTEELVSNIEIDTQNMIEEFQEISNEFNNIASFLTNLNNSLSATMNNNQSRVEELDSDDEIIEEANKDSDDEDSDDSDIESDDEDLTDDELPDLIPNTIPHQMNMNYSNVFQTSNNPSQFLNFSLNNMPINNIFQNTFSNTQTPDEFLNTFSELINSINLNNPEMDDVKVTLDDNDVNKINTEVLQSDSKEKCSICMMEMKKDNKICKLDCKHNFHEECIMQWLKEYNYKCPVCRKECGKAKFHLSEESNV